MDPRIRIRTKISWICNTAGKVARHTIPGGLGGNFCCLAGAGEASPGTGHLLPRSFLSFILLHLLFLLTFLGNHTL
jgi:hypothetical protein